MRSLVLLGVLASVAVLGAGCGSECGEGTVEENGVCVPEGLGKCGAGTALQNGECKPQCGAGLTAGTAGCVVGQGSCGAGTELVEGQCRVLDFMRGVTQAEAAEPNDTVATAQRFALPAVGAADVVLGGKVDVVRATGPDFDWYAFQGLPLQRVKLEAIAVGAPSIAVELVPANGPVALARYVVALDARSASREIVLPVGGEWLVKVSETNNFGGALGGMPRGAESFTYVVKVSSLAPVAPRTLDGQEQAGSFLAGDVYSMQGGSQLALAQLELTTPGDVPFSGARAVWAVDADGKVAFADADRLNADGSIGSMETPRLVVPPGGVTVGVDAVFAVGGSSSYTVRAAPVAVQPVAEALPYEVTGSLESDGIDIYSIDAPENTILHATILDSGSQVSDKIELRNSRFELVASDSGYNSNVRGFVKPGESGRWFVIVMDGDFKRTDTSLDYEVRIAGYEVASLGTLEVPGSLTQTFTVDGNTEAWASVTVPSGARIAIGATPDSSIEGELAAFDASLNSLDSDFAWSSGEALELDPLLAEANSVLLIAVSGDVAGNIEVGIEAEAFEFPPENEPNNTIATATPVDVSAGELEIPAFFGVSGDVDYYRFELTAASDVKLETVEGVLGGSPDTVVTFYDANGGKIDEDDDGGSSLFSLIEASAQPAGTYYVSVRAYGSSSSERDYTLQITIGAP